MEDCVADVNSEIARIQNLTELIDNLISSDAGTICAQRIVSISSEDLMKIRSRLNDLIWIYKKAPIQFPIDVRKND